MPSFFEHARLARLRGGRTCQMFLARLMLASLPLLPACGGPGTGPGPGPQPGPGIGGLCTDHPYVVLLDAGTDMDALNCFDLCQKEGTRRTGFCEPSIENGMPAVVCHTDCTGRLPSALVAQDFLAPMELGSYLARMAYLESAAVCAFRELRAELAVHGASPGILSAIDRAAKEELGHAAHVRRLADRHGASTPEARVAWHEPRSLVEIALDNAVEGCVRETFGALVAGWQSLSSRLTDVREVMARIAVEETRHALLGWNLAAWMEERLAPHDRKTVTQARKQAAYVLLEEIESTDATRPPPKVAESLGLPAPDIAGFWARELIAAV